MFSWFETLSIDNSIQLIRNHFSIIYAPPDWFIYSLPNGLWLYSVTFFYVIIWSKKKSNIKYFWLIIGPLIGIGSEVLQLLKIFPGTFSLLDMIFLVIAASIPFYLKTERWVLS